MEALRDCFRVVRPIEKLTILGLGRSINDWIAYKYSGFGAESEVWTINAGGSMFRHDVLWDMHTETYVWNMPEADRERVIKRRQALATHDKPIIMPQAHDTLPTSVTFPLKEVIELTGCNYFNNGTAYMLATALCCQVQKLDLFGVDFVGPQYELQRACTMYWLGRLVETGCRIGGSSTEIVESLRCQSGGILYGYHEPAMFEYGEGGPKFVSPDYPQVIR